ncbi:MAG: glycosyltransferase family 2 protein [bacterium]|nr:glycosyltransferase family 2 protein [bacterium]
MTPTDENGGSGERSSSEQGSDQYDLTVVIACYQEEGHLRDSVRELTAELDATGKRYELLFLEDKSTDRTADVIRELVANQPDWRAIYHEQNVGRGGTVTEGFLLARGDVVGFLDIDLEVHARFLPPVLAAIDDGADGATAFRGYKVGLRPQSIVRHILSQGYRWLFRMLFDVPFKDPETGFKFFKRERIVPVVQQTRDKHWFWDSEIMVLAHKAGLRIVEVPCRFERRADKQSTVRIVSDVWKYLVAIRAFRRRLRAGHAPASTRADGPTQSSPGRR